MESRPPVSVELSLVIPVYNEAGSLDAMYRECTAALEQWGRPYELIFVDDGSKDASFAMLEALHARDPRVRVIQFRRNFGQTAAFAAGFAAANGRLIATSDADLQNDPKDLPAMIARIDAGADIVCGWRKVRKDPFISRRLPSMLANRLISWATGVRLNDYGCSLKVFRAEVVKPLRLYGELHRFLPALASEMGVTIVEAPVNHRPRQHGTSKYGISRTFRVILDLLTVKFLLSYSTRPFQMFGLVGGLMGSLGVFVLSYLTYVKYGLHQGLTDRQPALLFGILLVFTGVQLVTVGLIAELQSRTYHESQGKAIYVIRRTLDARKDA